MKEVRWGMIGAGDVCERKSGPPLYQVDRSQLTLVHRRDPEAGRDFTKRHAGRYVRELDEMLQSDEIDAVYVASPHALHAEHAIAALGAGKHVLVEKPMALSAADCSRMIEAARQAERSLAVAYYRRGYPSIDFVRALIKEGAVGTVQNVSINGEFPTSHRLDLVHFLLGDITMVRLLNGSSTGYRFERMAGRIEARATLSASDKTAIVTMSDTWTETGMPEAIIIEGTSGRIHLRDLKGGSVVVEHGTHEEHPSPEYREMDGLPYTHWGLIENFVAHLVDGASLLCDGVEGRKSTLVLDALGSAETAADTEWRRIEEA